MRVPPAGRAGATTLGMGNVIGFSMAAVLCFAARLAGLHYHLNAPLPPGQHRE